MQTNSFTSPSALSDGENIIKVRSQDQVGNVSEYGIHSIFIDTTSPEVPVVSSSTPSTTSNRPTWGWGIISDAEKYNWKLEKVTEAGELISNVLVGSTSLNSFTPNQNLGDGYYKLSVSAIDELENESSFGSFVVFVDSTPPEIPIISADSETRNRRPIWSYSSESEDVSQYGVVFNQQTEFYTSDTSFIPTEDLENGKYTLKVRAKDELNNWSEQSEKDVIVYCIPSTYDITKIPTTHTSPIFMDSGRGNTFIQFLPNDQFGFDYDNFTFASNGGGSLAIQINNEHIGDIIFGGGTMPAVGTCIYLQREGICYWAKVEEPLSGQYLSNFTPNFTGECE